MVGRYSDGDDYKVLFDNEKESKQSVLSVCLLVLGAVLSVLGREARKDRRVCGVVVDGYPTGGGMTLFRRCCAITTTTT